jgi:hypothetical protein
MNEKGLQKIRALFSFFPDTRRGWIWHLSSRTNSEPVAVASSGQSLSHSA